MNRIFLRTLALLSVGVGVTAAEKLDAQSITSPYRYVETRQEVGPVVGQASLSRGRFGFGPSGGLMLGARWGVQLSGPLSFDVVATSVSGTRDVIDPGRVEGQRVVDEADVLLGLVDARLAFTLTGNRTWNGLAPFLQAGGGLAFDLAGDDPADETVLPEDRFSFGTTFIGTFGGGTRLFISDRLALRGDANFSLHKLETPPGFGDPDRGFEAVEESEWVSGLLVTLAVGIRF